MEGPWGHSTDPGNPDERNSPRYPRGSQGLADPRRSSPALGAGGSAVAANAATAASGAEREPGAAAELGAGGEGASSARPAPEAPLCASAPAPGDPRTHLGLQGAPRPARQRLLPRVLRLLPGCRLRSLSLAFVAAILLLLLVLLPGGVVPPGARLVLWLVLLPPEAEQGRHGSAAGGERESERARPHATKPGTSGGGTRRREEARVRPAPLPAAPRLIGRRSAGRSFPAPARSVPPLARGAAGAGAERGRKRGSPLLRAGGPAVPRTHTRTDSGASGPQPRAERDSRVSGASWRAEHRRGAVPPRTRPLPRERGCSSDR